MGLLPPKLREKGDLWSWCKRLGDYLASTVLRGGRGIRVKQTDGGTTVSLGQHGADHTPGGFDPIEFDALIVLKKGSPDKSITLDPDTEDFSAGRILAVNDDGTGTLWRTLLDLLDGLTGFEAGKVLAVNDDEDGLEFIDAGGELPADLVTQKAANPFQENKLVLGSSTARELWGTSIGINTHGTDYAEYGNLDVPTDARAAAIADSRFNARGGIVGAGDVGKIAVFFDDKGIEGRTLIQIMQAAYGILGTYGVVLGYNSNGLGWKLIGTVLNEIQGIGANKVLITGSDSAHQWADISSLSGLPSSPQAGDLVYYNGSAWVRLAKPEGDRFLKNTASGAVSWSATGGIVGAGDIGKIAVFFDDKGIESKTLTEIMQAAYGNLGTYGVVLGYNSNGLGWKLIGTVLNEIQGIGANKVLITGSDSAHQWADISSLSGLPSSPQAGDLVYYNGSAWVRLAKPGADRFLKNTASGAVSWSATPSIQSSGGTGFSLVTTDGKIKTIYGY